MMTKEWRIGLEGYALVDKDQNGERKVRIEVDRADWCYEQQANS